MCEVAEAPVVGKPSGTAFGVIPVPFVDEIVQDQAFYIKLCDK